MPDPSIMPFPSPLVFLIGLGIVLLVGWLVKRSGY